MMKYLDKLLQRKSAARKRQLISQLKEFQQMQKGFENLNGVLEDETLRYVQSYLRAAKEIQIVMQDVCDDAWAKGQPDFYFENILEQLKPLLYDFDAEVEKLAPEARA